MTLSSLFLPRCRISRSPPRPLYRSLSLYLSLSRDSHAGNERFAETRDEIPASSRPLPFQLCVRIGLGSIWISKKARRLRLAHNAPVNHPGGRQKAEFKGKKSVTTTTCCGGKGRGRSLDWSISNEYLRRSMRPPLFDAPISSKEELRISSPRRAINSPFACADFVLSRIRAYGNYGNHLTDNIAVVNSERRRK